MLVLAVLFVIAVLNPRNLPGEEVLPTVYRQLIHKPLLAQAAGATHREAIDLVKLRAELARSQHQVAELKDQLGKARQLAGLTAKSTARRRPRPIDGWIYAVETNPYRVGFRIDVGQAVGVRSGMPVVVGSALMGTVTSVDKHGATVRRIDDPTMRMEVKVLSEEGALAGIAVGAGDREMEIRLVRKTGRVRPGDKVFTMMGHAIMPGDLFVGEVSSVEDFNEDGVLEIRVTPAVSLSSWAEVTVLDTGRK